jgi:hypothetical protein
VGWATEPSTRLAEVLGPCPGALEKRTGKILVCGEGSGKGGPVPREQEDLAVEQAQFSQLRGLPTVGGAEEMRELGVEVHTCDPSTWKAEAGGA